MVNNPNLVFTDPEAIRKPPMDLASWKAQYENCVDTFGQHSKELAGLFAAAGRMNYPIHLVPAAIMVNASRMINWKTDAVLARDVSEFLKNRPALMQLRYVDGGIDTFRPFVLAGTAYLIQQATGEEPTVDMFPVREGNDIFTLDKSVYLLCYGPNAAKELVAYYEGGGVK